MPQQHARFEPLSEIGQGPFGTVSRGWDNQEKRKVAILELHEGYRRDAARLDEIWARVVELSRLRHPYLVEVYAVEREQCWIISEWLPHTFAEIATAPIAADAIRSMLRRSLEVLTYLHGKDTFHLDIRPKTILIDERGGSKLYCSLAHALCGEIPRRMRSGKYLAPELLSPNFGAVGPSTDLYCLGFTALELLAGPDLDNKFVRAGQDPQSVWSRLHGSPEPITPAAEIVPGLPDDLARLIDRLLAKQANERCETARQALRELKKAGDVPFVPAPIPALTSLTEATVTHASSLTRRSSSTRKQESNQSGRRRGWLPLALKRNYLAAILLGLVLMLVAGWFWKDKLLQKDSAIAERTVKLTSEPSDANVEIEGIASIAAQRTPAEFQLPPGEYSVILSKPGFEKQTEAITVAEGDPPLSRHVTLQATKSATTHVTTTSVPHDASVEVVAVDSQQSQSARTPTDFNLTPGTYEFRVSKSGFDPVVKKVEIRTGQDKTPLHFELTAAATFVKISAEPRDMRLTINDQPTSVNSETGEVTVPISPDKSLTLKAESPGYQSLQREYSYDELVKNQFALPICLQRFLTFNPVPDFVRLDDRIVTLDSSGQLALDSGVKSVSIWAEKTGYKTFDQRLSEQELAAMNYEITLTSSRHPDLPPPPYARAPAWQPPVRATPISDSGWTSVPPTDTPTTVAKPAHAGQIVCGYGESAYLWLPFECLPATTSAPVPVVVEYFHMPAEYGY
jgi:serine/threonine-protein kinase